MLEICMGVKNTLTDGGKAPGAAPGTVSVLCPTCAQFSHGEK